LAALILHQPLHRRLREASRSMAAAADASKVAAANLALLKIAAGTTLLAGWSQLVRIDGKKNECI